ncbi:MAG: hypothetical protein QOC82_3035 [Frankiaceae bacterium]|jgi:hypothetical protein|nr:hypothetical protein [Frankiaceae bacterium]
MFGKLRKARVATAAVSIAVPATILLTAGPADALASDCHSYITSSGQPGGGNTGICYGGQGWYQEVGLCQNIFTWSSWWVNGPWKYGGASYAPCPWYAKPVGGYVRLGSTY